MPKTFPGVLASDVDTIPNSSVHENLLSGNCIHMTLNTNTNATYIVVIRFGPEAARSVISWIARIHRVELKPEFTVTVC
jgi:hypothetical protein